MWWPPNGLELSCPAEAGKLPLIVAHTGGPGTLPYPPARRVSFSELLGRAVAPRRPSSHSWRFGWQVNERESITGRQACSALRRGEVPHQASRQQLRGAWVVVRVRFLGKAGLGIELGQPEESASQLKQADAGEEIGSDGAAMNLATSFAGSR
jgi:hypothetical protein